MFYQIEHICSPEHLVVEKNCNYSFPPHIHQCFEVIILNEGKMTVTVDGKIYTLNKDEAIIIFPNQLHSLDSKESRHTLCIFSSDYVKVFSQKIQNKIPDNNKFCFAKCLLALFEQLEENHSEMFRKGILYLICDAFHCQATYKSQNTGREDLLHSIFAFVDKHFDENCSLSLLAKESGYNYSYISRCFKNAAGMTFNTYLNNYRLNHACYMIKNGSASVLQCAIDSGFGSLRSFNRSFKQSFGMTPTEYKNRIKKAR